MGIFSRNGTSMPWTGNRWWPSEEEVNDYDLVRIASEACLVAHFSDRREPIKESLLHSIINGEVPCKKYSEVSIIGLGPRSIYDNFLSPYDIYSTPMPIHSMYMPVQRPVDAYPSENFTLDNTDRIRLLAENDLNFENQKEAERVKKRSGKFQRRVLLEKNHVVLMRKRAMKLFREKVFRSILPLVKSVASEFKQGEVCDITSFDGVKIKKRLNQKDKLEIAQFIDDRYYLPLGASYPENPFMYSEPTSVIKHNVVDKCRLDYDTSFNMNLMRKSSERIVLDNLRFDKVFDALDHRTYFFRKVLVEKYQAHKQQRRDDF